MGWRTGLNQVLAYVSRHDTQACIAVRALQMNRQNHVVAPRFQACANGSSSAETVRSIIFNDSSTRLEYG